MILSFRTLTLIILALIIIASVISLLTPFYKFKDPQPFSGNEIFNPYSGIDSAYWIKAHFHCHTTASDGENSLEEVQEAYSKYGYRILAISDNSIITNQGARPEEEIPAYEHGINLSLFHSVVIGARKSSVFDLVLVNTRSNRYNMLKWLNGRGDIVILAHPDRVRWFKPEHMKTLSYYHMMELERKISNGELSYYDTALSNGHYSGIIASDDCHNINSSGRFGRAANFVNTKSRNYNNIRDAMLSGKHFALMMPIFTDEEYKLQRNLNLPAINYLDLTGDTVKFSVSEPATINVFGQKGLLKYSFSGVTGISIPFTPENTYLRFAAIFADGVILYTNPLVRFNGKQIAFQTLASVNYPLTIVQFLLISTLLAVSLRFFWIILRKMVTQRMT